MSDYSLPPLPPLPSTATAEQRDSRLMLEWQTRALDGRLSHSATKATLERKEVCDRLDKSENTLGRVESTIGKVYGEVSDSGTPGGPLSRVLTWMGSLPLPVQLALVSMLGPLAYQLSGAFVVWLTGQNPVAEAPGPSLVPGIGSAAASASADDLASNPTSGADAYANDMSGGN